MRQLTKVKEMKPQTTDTLIGAGTSIEGKLESNASIRIDGSIRGDIHCKGDLYIGEKAVLHSDIHASNVYLAGKIHGTVTTNGTLFISQSGRIYGDLDVAKIQVAEGALFEGTIIMRQPEESNLKPVHAQAKADTIRAAK